MTLLRRAPREVYRVYDEDEFLAAEECGRQLDASAPSPHAWRLRRLAGPTLLLALTGLVGALIAITGVSPGAGTRRRTGARLLAATGAALFSRAARAHPRQQSAIWREGASKRAPAAARQRDRLVARVHEALRNAVPSRVLPHQQVPLHGRPEISTRASAPAAASPPSSPIELAAASVPQSSDAPTSTVVSASPRRSGQTEFGFER